MMKVALQANDEMVLGYSDGFDFGTPEPSANRTDSYRHGFANGRADRTRKPRATYEWLIKEADRCILLDAHYTIEGDK
jgi:hypothetical protein